MKVEGACHCGNIRYEAELDPEMVGICHCTDCQALSGSAYRVSARVSADSFVLSGGPPTVYIKTADSGTKRAHAFCPLCGSPIYAAAPENPPTYSLRVGALKQRADLPPVRQIWCGSAVPWSMDISEIPRSERG
jgi:hypothetical protein